MDLNLAGKAVIVTGGTRGIGAAIVDAFVAEGAKVAFCARDQAQVDARLAQLRSQGATVLGDVVDLADKATYLAWIDHVAAEFKGLDIFVANVSGGYNAGIKGWQTAFDIDMMATVMGVEKAMPHLRLSDHGAITLITTISGLEQFGDASSYGAMKAGLVSYGGMLSETAGAYNVRVNCVSPGPIYVEDGSWGQAKRENPDHYKQVEARHHKGRLGQPEEVADAVLYLSSPRAGWVTGTNLIVDGGFSKRIQF